MNKINKKVFLGVFAGVLAFLFIATSVVYFGVAASLSDICNTLEIEGLEKDYEDRVNVLLIGVDGGETRTDTIMLASLDLKNKGVSLLSIPRDTRIRYNNGWDKINHLYGYDKSGQLTIDTIKEITGAEINYVALINFDGFSKVVDELGGVDIVVPDMGNGGMYYDDPAQDLHIELPAGPQHLNGEQAQGFVRFRSGYANADLGRVETQRYFIQELVNQKLSARYITKVPAVINALEGDLRTNYGCGDIIAQMTKMIGMDSSNINSYTLPGHSGMASTRYGTLSCFTYDEAETKELIRQHFTDFE